MDHETYDSTWGPTDGPIRMSDMPPALGVVTGPAAPPMPTGMAFPVGHVPDWRGPVVAWRLEVDRVELPGRWVWERRGFIPMEEWEERAAIREEGAWSGRPGGPAVDGRGPRRSP